jgi:hypothetical protein
VELQSRVDDLRSAGLGLAAISYDSLEVLAAFSARHGITFPLLSDAASVTIKAYGILNTVAFEALEGGGGAATVEADVRKFVAFNGSPKVAAIAQGTPYPGTFTVDRTDASRHGILRSFTASGPRPPASSCSLAAVPAAWPPRRLQPITSS